MAVSVVVFLLILAMAGYSDAAYCVCNSGSDTVLQKNIDYACGNGADCTPIQLNGACYSPTTVKNHCDYAVNSYYQRKGQGNGTCDFSGSATITTTNPSTVPTCVYPSSPSNTGTPISGTPTTPSTGTTPTTGTPTAGGTGTPTAGGTGTPTAGSTGTPGTPSTGGSTFPGGTNSPPFGLGPTGSGGFPSTDSSAGVKLVAHNMPFTLISISVILISCFVRPRI